MLALHTLSSLCSSKCFSKFICFSIGRYYLVDVGYAICEGYLPPYQNQKYHIKIFIEEEQKLWRKKNSISTSRVYEM
ncbi:hypothetical protein Zm00014a_021282 [Zea mays]|jgi:hypothetical protein|uniref:Uncharacterized protein n=1 Tax=Zea mays TaxID=4577 RepID=A0A3L6G5L0_MAIZE|nr:hypothetical protein Zm00014a_021282 [Zea mays]